AAQDETGPPPPEGAATHRTKQDEPPVSEREAIRTAEREPEVAEARAEHPDLHPSPTRADSDRDWEVGFFADDDQLVQVIVDDRSGEVEEVWTGDQVAWRMARGYEGAFGRTLNAPYVWLPLCAVFLVGLFDWRRPLRIAHLDLLAIVAGFGVSHFFFNRGEIGLSAPLAYPALTYLLARSLWLGFRGGGGLSPRVPIAVLAIVTVALIGLRLGLNVADSNVIDVGYAGVVGADKIADDEPLYGDFPNDNRHGDTYGPVAYYVYVPFEQLLPWGGSWDDLPAAHAGAIFFDLATIAALFALGLRLRSGAAGRALGVTLAFAWTACPYTAFALESNSNDSLVSLLLVLTLLVLSSPPARGAMLALASLTKFAPLALLPLLATYDNAPRAGGTAGGPAPRNSHTAGAGGTAVTGPARRAFSVIAGFVVAFAVTTLVVLTETWIDPGLGEFWERTIENQWDRDSPFSVWGQEPSLGWLKTALTIAAGALAVAVAFVPRRRDLVTVAALGAAILIATQLVAEHWFYLYIPWFAPL
ncbi:MAG: PepSY domain-containing protein, partial [Solirubrobacterales bacterium]